MTGTIQQIAEMAGVSRGTVDRALNNRGRINPEVAQKIRMIADDIGYQPKRTKKVLTKDGTGFKIGVITQLCSTSFMLEVNRGIRKAGREMEERGVELLIRESETVDEAEQIKAIDELEKENIHGLAIMPVDSQGVRDRLNALIENKKIPVVTFNSDIVGTRRSCFVGLDNKKSGYTAAGLMGMLTRGAGKILTITGFFTNSVNSLRVEGFIEEMKRSFPDTELLGVQSSYDDAGEVERIITSTLSMVPDLAGIFVASGGQEGVHRALEKLKLERRPYVIVYDLTPENARWLEEGDFDFLIDQEGFEQGSRPIQVLFDCIAKGKMPSREYVYTDIKIKTKYNL